ncbi:rhomboid family intramembrane serine protease [Sphingobacterium daejeonense]|uniref:rhomboid family intramembrane serine protease n=1 Tax=Sphingobacterium daejeonense TaxID=371142 RepID=UPI0010C4C1D9|nr:rhomboid family intramembrane serine protease [Sphingobacterium daejeonense]MCT1530719.1 rhomboid family intramembrane serine protease [Sphingobacterium daejeonense]VTQ05783.1 Rhomboid family [Sphingobacterium daejeonense]
MKKESGLKMFFRTTYQTGSPIPYILSIQIILFVLLHIADLLVDLGVISFPLYDWMLTNLTLPNTFSEFILRPWTLVTYPFVYDGLFRIVFDCLWLYWMGTTFLNFLNKRQLLTVFFVSFFLSGLSFLALSQVEFLAKGPYSSLFSNSMGLASLVASIMVLVPNLEIRLFLFGTVRFRTIAIVFFSLEILFYLFANRAAAATFPIAILWGAIFMYQLQAGNDLSKWFVFQRKKKLRVVHPVKKVPTYRSYKGDLPNQEVIDEILDKISQNGYESLSSREKEILFRISREEQE